MLTRSQTGGLPDFTFEDLPLKHIRDPDESSYSSYPDAKYAEDKYKVEHNIAVGHLLMLWNIKGRIVFLDASSILSARILSFLLPHRRKDFVTINFNRNVVNSLKNYLREGIVKEGAFVEELIAYRTNFGEDSEALAGIYYDSNMTMAGNEVLPGEAPFRFLEHLFDSGQLRIHSVVGLTICRDREQIEATPPWMTPKTFRGGNLNIIFGLVGKKYTGDFYEFYKEVIEKLAMDRGYSIKFDMASKAYRRGNYMAFYLFTIEAVPY